MKKAHTEVDMINGFVKEISKCKLILLLVFTSILNNVFGVNDNIRNIPKMH